MPLTNQTRVAIGQWYVAEIKRRIDVRKACADTGNASANAQMKVLATKTAEKLAKAHRLGSLSRAEFDDHYVDGQRKWFIELHTADGLFLQVPVALLPDVERQRKDINDSKDIAKGCCEEVAFLNPKLGNAAIAGFQSYVSKLYSGADKPSEGELKDMLDTYLQACRPAVCKIA